MPRRALAAALLLLAGSCELPFFPVSPVLEASRMPVVGITTTGGRELGVTTDEGVLFLGRTSRKGPAKVLYWLEDAPLVEAGEIRPVGGSLHRVDLEVDVPTVPLSFEPLRAGERLVLLGLDDDRVWRHEVVAAGGDIATGTAVRWPRGLDLRAGHVGAGVFRENEGGLALVGLVKATADIEGGGRFLVLAGLPEFRVALLEPRSAVPEREVVYRADGVRTIRTKR